MERDCKYPHIFFKYFKTLFLYYDNIAAVTMSLHIRSGKFASKEIYNFS